MAIWQYDLVIVPRQSLLAKFTNLPKEIPPEIFDIHNWWEGGTAPDDQEFLTVSPRSNSWSDSIKAWGGNSDGNRLELHYHNGVFFELKARIDLREIDKDFLDAVLRLAARHDWVLWTDEGLLLEPELCAISRDIIKSKAFSFVRNPEEFLNKLNQTGSS